MIMNLALSRAMNLDPALRPLFTVPSMAIAVSNVASNPAVRLISLVEMANLQRIAMPIDRVLIPYSIPPPLK